MIIRKSPQVQSKQRVASGRSHMKRWLEAISARGANFRFDEEGATATEYAVIITVVILAIAASVYYLANFEGNGVAQRAFEAVGNKAGQFGKIE